MPFFNQHYVKTGIFDRELSKIIDSCYRLREKADYDDFYLVAKEEAELQLEKAKKVYLIIEKHIAQL